jgi:integrase
LLYGNGLHLSKLLSLRFKDLDFSQPQIVVRDTKGQKSRVTMLLNTLTPFLQEHFQRVRSLHERDLMSTIFQKVTNSNYYDGFHESADRSSWLAVIGKAGQKGHTTQLVSLSFGEWLVSLAHEFC